MAVALAVQQLLPLADHAHPLVVEDEDLDRQVVLNGRRHLLHGHLDAGVAGDVDDQAVGVGHLHADGGRQAVAHGAQAAGGHPAVGLVEVVELGRPHLVLADLGGDVGVAVLGQLIQPLDGVLRLDQLGVRAIARSSGGRASRRSAVHQSSRATLSGLRSALFQAAIMSSSTLPASPTMPMSAAHVLADRGGVDVDVDLLASPARRRPGGRSPGRRSARRSPTITSQSCMALLASNVPCMPSMPSHCGSDGREGAQAHQGGGHRRAGQGGQLAQQLRGRAGRR